MNLLVKSSNNAYENALVENRMNLSYQNIKAILFPVGIALSLCIFVATFFEVYSDYQVHRHISSPVISIGASIFLIVMTWFHYIPQKNDTVFQQLVKAVTVASAETVLFIALLWFLALNTILDRSIF